MAYYFMSEVSRGQYRKIDISKSKYFTIINKRFKEEFSYTLPEIDQFTIMFEDEKELRERLVEEGILPISLFEKPLSIRNRMNGEYNKVPYNFLYQDDIEYVMEPDRLIERIMRKFYDHDFSLIKKIVSRFDGDYFCKSTLPEVRQHIENSIREGQINKHFYDLDENNDKLLPRLLKLIILESSYTKDGKTVYKNKIRYRNLHILIGLVNYHEKKEQIIEEPIFKSIDNNNNNNNEPIFTDISQDNQSNREYEFVKKRTLGKKKHTLDEQISFDI